VKTWNLATPLKVQFSMNFMLNSREQTPKLQIQGPQKTTITQGRLFNANINFETLAIYKSRKVKRWKGSQRRKIWKMELNPIKTQRDQEAVPEEAEALQASLVGDEKNNQWIPKATSKMGKETQAPPEIHYTQQRPSNWYRPLHLTSLISSHWER